MITPKVTNCKNCAEILPLIEEINCKIYESSLSAYNNIVFALNLYIDYPDVLALLHYRRILQYKLVNPDYVKEVCVTDIASKVKLRTLGCVSKCNCKNQEPIAWPTTTTTSTVLPTTTTTTTAFCDTWFYNVTNFTCDCVEQSNQTHANGVQLNIGSFYYSEMLGRKVRINGFDFPCDDEGLPITINPATESATCGGVICPTTTTTTSSCRPPGLINFNLMYGYTLSGGSFVNFTATEAGACAAAALYGTPSYTFSLATHQATSFTVGTVVYDGISNDCNMASTGYYISNPSIHEIVHIVDGVIISIGTCSATASLNWEHDVDDSIAESTFKIYVNSMLVVNDAIATTPLINSGNFMVPIGATVDMVMESFNPTPVFILAKIESTLGCANTAFLNSDVYVETTATCAMPGAVSFCSGKNY